MAERARVREIDDDEGQRLVRIYAAKTARIEHLYIIADHKMAPGAGDPQVIFCADEFGR